METEVKLHESSPSSIAEAITSYLASSQAELPQVLTGIEAIYYAQEHLSEFARHSDSPNLLKLQNRIEAKKLTLQEFEATVGTIIGQPGFVISSE